MQTLLFWWDWFPHHQLGCYGQTEASTPGFDQLAAAGVTFDRCYLTDVCEPSPSSRLVTTIESLRREGVNVRVVTEEASELGRSPDEHIAIVSDIVRETKPIFEEFRSTSDGLIVIGLAGVESLSDVAAADGLVAELVKHWSSASPNPSLTIATAGRGAAPNDNPPAHGLTERSLHVPLIIKTSGISDFGVREQSLVSVEDVLRTIVSCRNIDVQDSHNGRPLVTRDGRAVSFDGHQRLTFTGRDHTLGLRTEDWFLIARHHPTGSREAAIDAAAESAELYAKPGDLWDQLDVSQQSPTVVEDLIAQLFDSIESDDSRLTNRDSE